MAINFFFYKFMTRFSVFCCFLSNKICSSLVSQQPFITLKYFSIHNLKTNLKKQSMRQEMAVSSDTLSISFGVKKGSVFEYIFHNRIVIYKRRHPKSSFIVVVDPSIRLSFSNRKSQFLQIMTLCLIAVWCVPSYHYQPQVTTTTFIMGKTG